ncbi:MAG: tRNA guanosine(34) transglycosylase Tgt [Nanoarchaeota archaeon]
MTFNFKITHKDKNSQARTGVIETQNGKIETPYLIPVATRAFIIGLTKKDIKELKIQALLSNTYHLHLKPGDKIIKEKGGLHKLMNFKGIIYTDSGGFQAFSLGDAKKLGLTKLNPNIERIIHLKNKNEDNSLVKITNKGVYFNSIYDNSEHFIDAKKSMEIQSNLGGDAIMAFDECSGANKSYNYQKKALERTNNWASKSLKYHNKKQALYGIIQGGNNKSLRVKSAKFILSKKFEGIAIGGSFGDSFGDSKNSMLEVIDWIKPLWNNDARPRHMLGIGWIDDIFELVERGIDTFDCVHMTRIARHGNLLISPDSGGSVKNKFRIKIKKGIFKEDKNKIDKNCNCKTCKTHTRSQMHNLIKKDKMKFGRLATIHNISFMLSLMEKIRQSIKENKFNELKEYYLKN